MSSVTPINPNMLTLHETDVLQRISQVKWAYSSTYGHPPTYLVIGGNYWLQLQDRMRRIGRYAGLADLTGTLTQVQGLDVVVMKRDILECGA